MRQPNKSFNQLVSQNNQAIHPSINQKSIKQTSKQAINQSTNHAILPISESARKSAYAPTHGQTQTYQVWWYCASITVHLVVNLDTKLCRTTRQTAHRLSGLEFSTTKKSGFGKCRRRLSLQFHSSSPVSRRSASKCVLKCYFSSRVTRSVSPCFAILRRSLNRAYFRACFGVQIYRSRSRSRSSPCRMRC